MQHIKKTNIRAFLFDMDGLLLDTEMIHMRAYMELTRQLGCPQKADTLKRFIGHSHHVVCRWLVDELGCTDSSESLIAREQELYFSVLHNERPAPLPGVREWFDLADRMDMKRALVSSSVAHQVGPTMQIVTAHLNRAGAWKDNFQAICTGDRVSKLKPSPDLYILAMKELELDPGACVAFEDSPAGVAAAHAAGCRVVAVPNMYLKADEVTQGKTGHVYKTLADAYLNLDAILN